MKISEIVYLGIRLDNKSRKCLIQDFLDRIGVALINYGKIYCDHITIQYGDAITMDMIHKIGTTRFIKTAKNFVVVKDRIVYLPVECKGVQNAHITIAGNGMVNPVESGKHLSENPYNGQYVKSELKGTLCAYMKDGSIIDHLQ